jgi:beta-glucanase (GH16 family)
MPIRPCLILTVAVAMLSAADPGPQRVLLWSDEFSRPGAPDPTIWNYEEGFVRNGEAQYYTRDRRENARVEDGHLVIEARREPWQGGQYTAASLTTKGKRPFLYGRVEIRAQIPTGRGMWPAFWTLGSNIDTTEWSRCGEIDIMENVGFDPDVIHFNIHTQAFNHMRGTNKGGKVVVAKPYAGFHVYAIEWTPSAITWSIDGIDHLTLQDDGGGIDHWPFTDEQYLLMNIAVGGGWGGQRGIDESIFPQRMLVDWVRVYAPLGATAPVAVSATRAR